MKGWRIETGALGQGKNLKKKIEILQGKSISTQPIFPRRSVLGTMPMLMDLGGRQRWLCLFAHSFMERRNTTYTKLFGVSDMHLVAEDRVVQETHMALPGEASF